MIRQFGPPVMMGAGMAAMGLWMLHGVLTGEGSSAGAAFVLAHGLVALVVLAGVAFGLHRRLPWLARVGAHRPSRRHIKIMLSVAMMTAALIHLGHGTPAWT